MWCISWMPPGKGKPYWRGEEAAREGRSPKFWSLPSLYPGAQFFFLLQTIGIE